MSIDEQQAVFQRWVRDHAGLMLKVVRTFADTPTDRDDLLQDVLFRVWLSIPKFRGISSETTWIYRVALNTALVSRRAERRRIRHHERYVTHAATVELAATTADRQPNHELIDCLYDAIHELPKLDASLVLMHLDGLSYVEMSSVLGISENYVGVKLNRIRRQLTEKLKGEIDEL
jgi:RNA polymerase sigma-70 factor (ECF subfamily)